MITEYSIAPKNPAEISSPRNTVNSMKKYPSAAPYAKISTGGTIIVFAIIVGMPARGNSFFDSLVKSRAPSAPISVARLPKITSRTTPPAIIFEIRHPINSAGIASGKKMGNIQSASETRS